MSNELGPCRTCGCTEGNCRACIRKTGAPCWWIDHDLCSACVPRTKAIGTLIGDVGNAALRASRGHCVVIALLDTDASLHLGSAHMPGAEEVTLSLRRTFARAMGGRDIAGVPQAAWLDGQPRPGDRAQCLYCGTTLTVEEGRVHMRTCEKSPLAQELAAAKKRIAQLEVELGDVLAERNELQLQREREAARG